MLAAGEKLGCSFSGELLSRRVLQTQMDIPSSIQVMISSGPTSWISKPLPQNNPTYFRQLREWLPPIR